MFRKKKETGSEILLEVSRHAQQLLEVYYGHLVKIKHILVTTLQVDLREYQGGYECRYLGVEGWVTGDCIPGKERKFVFNHGFSVARYNKEYPWHHQGLTSILVFPDHENGPRQVYYSEAYEPAFDSKESGFRELHVHEECSGDRDVRVGIHVGDRRVIPAEEYYRYRSGP